MKNPDSLTNNRLQILNRMINCYIQKFQQKISLYAMLINYQFYQLCTHCHYECKSTDLFT